PLAQDGYRVHAVEPAAGMRALLEQKARAAGAVLSVEDASAATFTRASGFHVAIFAFNGVMHLRTRAALVEAFAHIRDALVDEGRFALDSTGPYWSSMLYGPMAWGRTDERIHKDTGKKILTCDRSSFDDATREMRIDIRYLEEDAAVGVEIALHQTLWTWQQLLGALDDAGFAVELLFGDVNLSPFHEGSPRMLVSTRKR
ncbi:MAG TPA: class I SAM-dependent methyltransferase, partial [Myxococcota bacterium]